MSDDFDVEAEAEALFGPRKHLLAGRITAPLLALGVAAAWLLSDFYALGYARNEGSSRGMVLLVLPLALGLVGLALEQPRVAASFRRSAAVLAAGMLLGGLGVATVLAVSVLHKAGGVFHDTLLTALALTPVVGALTWAAHRTRRARPGSLLHAVDARAPWLGVALVAALGPLGVSVSPALRSFQATAFTTGAIGVLALVIVSVTAALDLVDWLRAVRLARGLPRLVARTAHSLPCDEVEDFGLGSEQLEEVQRGAHGYRSIARPTRIVLGSAAVALPLLRRSAQRSVAALGLTLLAFAGALHQARPQLFAGWGA